MMTCQVESIAANDLDLLQRLSPILKKRVGLRAIFKTVEPYMHFMAC